MGNGKKKRAAQVAVAVLALCLAAGLLVALRPPCLILKTTGHYCGACGFTRMVEELLHGRVAEAFRQNPYMFVVAPLAVVYLAGEALCYILAKKPLWKRKEIKIALAAVLAVGILFTVLRNLPGFKMLRPL